MVYQVAKEHGHVIKIILSLGGAKKPEMYGDKFPFLGHLRSLVVPHRKIPYSGKFPWGTTFAD